MNAGQPSRSNFGAAREIPFGGFRKRLARKLERTRAAVRRMCELGEVHQECDGLPGQRGVYRLTRSSEMLGVGASESIDCKIIDGIWPNEVEEAKSSSGALSGVTTEEYSRFTDSEGDLVEFLKRCRNRGKGWSRRRVTV